MKISELTRRDIRDAIHIESIFWEGRLDETAFLSRLYDLQKLPSTDGRFKDAEGDIWQHRVNNHDWEDDWIFYDSRFELQTGDDEIFLRFLCETIHPVVRQDVTEAERIEAERLRQTKAGSGHDRPPKGVEDILIAVKPAHQHL